MILIGKLIKFVDWKTNYTHRVRQTKVFFTNNR